MSEKMSEDATDLYNSAVVLGPDGFIGTYQKIHPLAQKICGVKKVKHRLCLIQNGPSVWVSAMTAISSLIGTLLCI